MDNAPGKPLNYPTRQAVFRYLKYGIRKQLHQKCGVPAPKQMSNKLPYNFDSVTVKTTYTGSYLIVIDECKRASLDYYYSYEFAENEIIRKTTKNGDRYPTTRKVFTNSRTPLENVEAFLKFQLNRENTRIRRFEIRTTVPNLELTHFLGVTDLITDRMDINTNLLSRIRAPVRKVHFYLTPETSTIHDLVLTAKKVNCFVYSPTVHFDWIHRLVAHKITLEMTYYEPPSPTEIAEFFKSFALIKREMNAQLKLKSHSDILKEVLRNVMADTQNNWTKKYFKRTQCASLTRESQEVLLHIDWNVLRLEFKPIGSARVIAPSMLRLSMDNAWAVLRYLPYPTREAIHWKPEYKMDFKYFPVQADEVVFECDGELQKAIVDGKAVERTYLFLYSILNSKSFIKHLIVRGQMGRSPGLSDVRVETLTLDSDEAIPGSFEETFARDALPKVIYANCKETTKHLEDLLKNAEVIYKNGNSDDGPPAKKAKLAVSDQ